MSNNNFFSRVKPNSAKKISIILNYFDYWLKRNASAKELYYVDLFCGPGVYENKEKSTPILILEKILKSKKLASKFHVILNDKNKSYMKKLETEIISMENISHLKSITFSTKEIRKEYSVPEIKKGAGFIILDPWGYKGISSEQIKFLTKNRDIEIVFLFSFNQLYRFLKFEGIDEQLLNLFSENSLTEIRNKVDKATNKERFLLDELMKNMISKNQNYLCYKFKFETQNKTSHFLVFLNHDNNTKAALLNIFLKQFNMNADWHKQISLQKDIKSSCFVLYSVVKYMNKIIRRMRNVIKYRMD